MGIALKKMVRDNNKNLSVIRDAAARMASGANEVASASNSLAQGTTEQASAIEEITASIEEIMQLWILCFFKFFLNLQFF